MQTFPIPANEKARVKALLDYNILDSIPEEEYDAITKIAAQICNVPASLITLLDTERQWFKSHHGVGITETPRSISFCNYTILNPDDVLIIPDMRKDERFASNPLVTGEPHAVFYAGAPLVTPEGHVMGSICVLDGKEGSLNEDQKFALKALAKQVITKMELRKKIADLKKTKQALAKSNKNLKDFARLVSHDMKTPVANISMLSGTFKKCFASSLDENALEFMDLIEKSSKELLGFIDDVLVKAVKGQQAATGKKAVDSYSVITKVINMVAPPSDFEIKLEGDFPKVHMDKTSLQQVFQNLITNAIKYNNKEKGLIHIMCSSDHTYHYFNIADNGSGIEKEHLKSIFRQQQTLNKTDRFGNKGTGFGLATVKDIIESSGGKIDVQSKKDIGSVFRIMIPLVA